MKCFSIPVLEWLFWRRILYLYLLVKSATSSLRCRLLTKSLILFCSSFENPVSFDRYQIGWELLKELQTKELSYCFTRDKLHDWTLTVRFYHSCSYISLHLQLTVQYLFYLCLHLNGCISVSSTWVDQSSETDGAHVGRPLRVPYNSFTVCLINVAGDKWKTTSIQQFISQLYIIFFFSSLSFVCDQLAR